MMRVQPASSLAAQSNPSTLARAVNNRNKDVSARASSGVLNATFDKRVRR